MNGWRLMRPEDLPAINLLNKKQAELTGQKVDQPDYFDKPILWAEVYEENGEIRGGYYLEAVAELCFIGTDRVTTEAAEERAEQVFINLRARGIRYIRTFVPKKLVRSLRSYLHKAGFEMFKGHAHFFRTLTIKEN